MTGPTMVAEQNDVEPLVRSTRAGLAKLRLHLRSVQADLERAERTPGTADPDGARELLRASLSEMLDRRRHELADDLARARHEAAAVIADAHEQAAAAMAARQRGASTMSRSSGAAIAGSLPLLAAVPLPEPAPAAPPLLSVVPEPVAPPRSLLSVVPQDDDARPEPLEQLLAAAREHTPPEALAVPEPVAPPLVAPTTSVAAVPSPEYLAQVVQAAVTASLASFGAAHEALGPNRVVVRAPLRRRLLHLDVILPLLAISVVLIVLLAWVA